MIFVRETRAIVCRENPDMHALQVMKEVGKIWQNLSVEAKQRFELQAKTDKERYSNEMKEFENSLSSKTRQIATVTMHPIDVEGEKLDKVVPETSKNITEAKKISIKKVTKNVKKRDLKTKNKPILRPNSEPESPVLTLAIEVGNHILYLYRKRAKIVLLQMQERKHQRIIQTQKVLPRMKYLNHIQVLFSQSRRLQQ